MPQLIDARIQAPKKARIWQTWYSAPSIRATGRTKQGTPVAVYAHTPNFFSNPENIKKARENLNVVNLNLVQGAGIMPEKEFQKLLDLEDNINVFVVDYKALKNSKSDIIPLKEALKTPPDNTSYWRQGKSRSLFGKAQGGLWRQDWNMAL